MFSEVVYCQWLTGHCHLTLIMIARCEPATVPFQRFLSDAVKATLARPASFWDDVNKAVTTLFQLTQERGQHLRGLTFGIVKQHNTPPDLFEPGQNKA
jgi:hypothetical protein